MCKRKRLWMHKNICGRFFMQRQKKSLYKSNKTHKTFCDMLATICENAQNRKFDCVYSKIVLTKVLEKLHTDNNEAAAGVDSRRTPAQKVQGS